MGLLDQLTYDPQMALGMGLLEAGGNSRMPMSLGQGLAHGFGQMQGTAQMAQRAKLMEQEALLKQQQMEQARMQMEQLKQAQQEHEQMQAAARAAFQSPAQQALAMGGQGPTNQAAAMIPNLQPKFDTQSFLSEFAKVNPLAALKMQQAMKKDPIKLGEGDTLLDPTTYKPLAQGQNKAAALPWFVRKGPNGELSIDPAYDSFEQKKAANMRPPAQPMAPVAYVNDKGQTVWGTIAEAKGKPAANFSPTVQGAIAGAKEEGKSGAEAKAKSKEAVKKSDQLLTVAKEAGDLLDKNVTQSGAGAAVDTAGRFVGYSPESSQNAAKLETLSGWLVANVPRMEGPQSNYDVENYKTMAGKVGDRTVPVPERKAALKSLVALQEKYKHLNQDTQGQGKTVVKTGMYGGKKVVQYSDGSVDYAD